MVKCAPAVISYPQQYGLTRNLLYSIVNVIVFVNDLVEIIINFILFFHTNKYISLLKDLADKLCAILTY